MSARPVLPCTKVESVGTPKCPQLAPRGPNFAAQWPARMYPYRCFALVLADADARLGASAGRYSFTVGLFHSFQLAGFDRRTGFSDTKGANIRSPPFTPPAGSKSSEVRPASREERARPSSPHPG